LVLGLSLSVAPEPAETQGRGKAAARKARVNRNKARAARQKARQKAREAREAAEAKGTATPPPAPGARSRTRRDTPPAAPLDTSKQTTRPFAGINPDGAPAEGKEEETPWTKVNVPEELETGIEFKRPKRGTKFSFNLVDADLIELVKIIGNITGKAFILGSKAPRIKATVYAPTKITAQEAYQVFLSVLQVNGLTVMQSGRYLKVMPIGGSTAQNTPILRGNVPPGDQIVSRLHHLEHVSAEELTPVLDRFKSPDGDITVYAPTNLLIITDYGVSIRRLMKLIAVLDAPGTGEQIWIEPINYADASEMAQRIVEVFDVEAAAKTTKRAKATAKKGKRAAAASVVVGQSEGDSTISKIIPDERTNTLIIVASESAYLRILELVRRLDVPIAGEGTLHVMKLQYADAEELSKTLSNLTKGSKGGASKKKKGAAGVSEAQLFEGEVQVSADKATNSLLVVSSIRDYMSLKNVVDQLDVMQQQVFVEAVVMEVGVDTQRDLGMGFHAGRTVNTGEGPAIVYGSSKPGEVDSMNISTAMLPGLATGVIGPEIPQSSELVGVSVPSFGVALNALQRNSDVNVLATPNILATDNNEASIQVGENVPISMGYSPGGALLSSAVSQAAAAGGAQSSALGNLSGLGGLGGVRYKRQDVGLTLKITPHINDDSQVRLEIELEVSAIKSVDPVAGPDISKKKASTTSVVGDQQTIVIGGLITDNEIQTTRKVPVLGDIPILGFFFRHKTTLKQKQNLLIFLTPYIIRTEDDFREIFSRKMAERREFIERWTAFKHRRVDPHLDWSRTSGVISEVNRVIKRAEDDEELRRMAEMTTDIEHSPKEPIVLNPKADEQNGAKDKAQDDAPGEQLTIVEIKELLSQESEEGESFEGDPAAPPPEPTPEWTPPSDEPPDATMEFTP
jgi:general secretion pathway protein D